MNLKRYLCLSGLVFLCTACGGGESAVPSSSADESAFVNNYYFTSVSRGGVLSYEQDVLIYHDSESEKTSTLCANPNCDHSSPAECTACYKTRGASGIAAFFYGGKLYVLVVEDEGTSSVLYRADADGQNRQKLMDVPGWVCGSTEMIVKNDQIYAVMVHPELNEKTGETAMYPMIQKIDISAKTAAAIMEPQKQYNAAIHLQNVKDGRVYYTSSCYDKNKKIVDRLAKAKPDEMNKLRAKYYHETAYMTDTAKNDTQKLELDSAKLDTVLSQDENGVYVLDKTGANLVRLNRTDGGRTLVRAVTDEEQCEYSHAFPDFYLFSTADKNGHLYHRIDYASGKEQTFTCKKRLIYRFALDNALYACNWDEEEGTAVIITKTAL